MRSPPPLPARERTASVLSRNLPGCGSEPPGGVSGSGRPYPPGGAQEPACGTQTGGAMRNASRHEVDLAYSTNVARSLTGYKRPPGGDAPLSVTQPLPRIGGPLSTARVPRRSSWRCDAPASSNWSIRISPLATPTATLTIYYLMKPRQFQPGASTPGPVQGMPSVIIPITRGCQG